MKNIPRIKGNKINLCSLRTDEEAILKYTKWMNDESINQYVSRSGGVATLVNEKDWANSVASSDTNLTFNIVEKESDNLIGNCDIRVVPNSRNAILGICIGESEGRNKGYGTEAISLMLNFCFNELNMHRVKLTVLADNTRAVKCYEKCGFVTCGHEHEVAYINGEYKDVLSMEILKKKFNVHNKIILDIH